MLVILDILSISILPWIVVVHPWLAWNTIGTSFLLPYTMGVPCQYKFRACVLNRRHIDSKKSNLVRDSRLKMALVL
jgi:hypothetical protein